MNLATCQLMRAKPLAERILARCRQAALRLREASGCQAGLGVVLVGGDELAIQYLERKRRACAQLGLHPVLLHLSATTSTEELIQRLTEWGRDNTVHGILLQYPLPDHIEERRACEAIAADKDVDCARAAEAGCWPCAVEGARLLLREYAISPAGKAAVVIGCGAMLAEPFEEMLRAEGAIVRRCKADAPDLSLRLASADIVVAAVGRPRFVNGDWLKAGAVVIDTGLNPGPDGPVGDVDADSARQRAGYLTPVPGGIGTITLAVLIERTIAAAIQQSP